MYFLIRKRFFSKAEKRENGVELLTHKTKWPRDRLVMTFFKSFVHIFRRPREKKTKFEIDHLQKLAKCRTHAT